MAEVSAGNPCPFLRALVAHRYLADDVEPLARVGATITRVAAAGEGSPRLPEGIIGLIALIANGLSPVSLARNARGGLRLNALRGGPLDKRGAGSRILDQHANVVEAELARMDSFAGDKRQYGGSVERGLDQAEIVTYMEANFARAHGRRRAIDRKLMDFEWPALLKVIGHDGPDGRYLSMDDVRTLIVELRLPQRMLGTMGDGDG